MSEQENEQSNTVRFADLALSEAVQAALIEIGYEKPSPIQARAIPVMLEGRDIIGQAQTGTGKTAAFALPLLSRLDPESKGPQAIILAPTRELALQVAEAITKYGSKIRKLSVAAIYGGADFGKQFRTLERNPTIVVGTPGRVMDHMRRGTLKLDHISHIVLDEADEMLRMGFIEDVEWILEQTPAERQTALFSATMPPRIAAIAKKQLRDPVTIAIKNATATVSSVRQRYVKCGGMGQKLEALADLLEILERDAAIVFTRTKSAATMVADELAARGHAADAIHGDISQAKREKAVAMLKNGQLDVLVATDVAARGLDIDRISHVFNFDIPGDVEPYIHRIGRAGRAGREGDAILLVTKRDLRMLREIETVTRQRMDEMQAPTRHELASARQLKLVKGIGEIVAASPLAAEKSTAQAALDALGCDALTLAAALLKLQRGGRSANPPATATSSFGSGEARAPRATASFEEVSDRPHKAHVSRGDRVAREVALPRRERSFDSDAPAPRKRPEIARERSADEAPAATGPVDRYRIEVGHEHRVKPGNIVGAIANEAGIDSKFIGRIDIFDDHTLVDLPTGMPREVLATLKKTWVAGQQMRMSLVKPEGPLKFARN